jgi:hypothetical protein
MGVIKTGRFVLVHNYLQAKALLEHSYAVYFGDPSSGLPLYACFLKDNAVIFAEYVFPNAAILRCGDWVRFEKLYTVAKEFDTLMYTIMQDASA